MLLFLLYISIIIFNFLSCVSFLILVVENGVDPCAPLHVQPYFHGRIARPNAESLVREDGDFLVRESTNKPGQYVLTGLSNGRPQHLLLIDKSGKVRIHNTCIYI